MAKEKIILTTRSNVRTLSIKVYDEQLPNGWDDVKRLIRLINKSEYQVIAIKHDRDTNKDDIWEPSIEKPHYHIIIRVLGKSPVHVSTILNMLGVVYRKGIDDNLWKEHGVESLRDFSNMAVYLTHETPEAVYAGKAKYELEELISNLELEEIKQVREGYIRVSEINRKVGMVELDELDKQAFKLGYELGDFNKWYQELPFQFRSHGKMKTIKESYYNGITKKIGEDKKVNRLSVFIQGEANVGKTYTTLETLKGKQLLSVDGGETGKYDDLSATTEAIVIDDDTSKHILNMADNKACRVYRRNSNNPWWLGKYLIVTSNLTFDEWITECGMSTKSKQYEPVKSRFYICHIGKSNGKNKLICDSPSTRGSTTFQVERREMFKKFQDTFNSIMSQYVPENEVVDYSEILDLDSSNSMTEEVKTEPEKIQKVITEPKINEESHINEESYVEEQPMFEEPEYIEVLERIFKQLKIDFEPVWFKDSTVLFVEKNSYTENLVESVLDTYFIKYEKTIKDDEIEYKLLGEVDL